MAGNARKLVVEVLAAKGLMPKDGEGSCNAYCVLDYDGQRKRTKVKVKDLDPTWNEKFEFSMSDLATGGDLELNVHSERKTSDDSPAGRRSSFLGRVVIPLHSVPSKPPEAARWYPLQKRGLFSQVKGDLGLKVYMSPDQMQKEQKQQQGDFAKDSKIVRTGMKADKQQQPQAGAGMRASNLLLTVPETDFTIKETNPDLGKAVDYNHHYGLVEQMTFLFIRVVKARGLAAKDAERTSDPYVRLTLRNLKAETKIIKRSLDPEWNQVFAVGEDKVQGGTLELTAWDADKLFKDDFLGGLMLDLSEVPKRKPPESPLAPQWYKLEAKTGKGGGRVQGEIMLAVWWGTQADEAFPEAWHSDTGGYAHFRSKVYLSPKLWYLRVNVIEAQDLNPRDKGRLPEPYVKAIVGPYQLVQSRVAMVKSATSPFWNEDLMFVAAEPFDELLHLLIEERVGNKVEVLGEVRIPLSSVERRIDGRPVPSRWYVLEKTGGQGLLSGRIHVRISLDGGYHVMDESPNYTSSNRPTAKQLWRPALGIVELGILGANSLLPMKSTKDKWGSTDAYCVAKYGPKWVRTRTICESFSPRWNEQYTWEVYDPCTVLTVGVFDNRHANPDMAPTIKDLPIGKIRIRLSTLESDRVYTNAYPLLVVTPQGVKKMGELELAVRLSSASKLNLMHAYLEPPMPRMHYFYPLDHRQAESLRVAAMNMVALRLMRSEPALPQEVVQFMLDTDAERWSMRRSKANYYRIMAVLNGVMTITSLFTDICSWKSPVTTLLVHFLFFILVWYPELLLPTLFMYMFLIGAWNYRFRARAPPFMDAKLSQGEHIGDLDELEEEFNVVPANKAQEVLKYRYERLRGVSGRIQNALGGLATMGERLLSLLSWRDPRATAIFIGFCLVAALLLYVTPFKVVVLLLGLYIMRHPRFQDPLPAVPLNFFNRLPSLSDRIL
ncbi:unnamed protein product [Sphagnum jensenii]|uniref:C2 domain-containing protein n=1 Tax=Sphagnum jensenii TaxID=128206 RepID=A0ABP0WLI2_9BRYO